MRAGGHASLLARPLSNQARGARALRNHVVFRDASCVCHLGPGHAIACVALCGRRSASNVALIVVREGGAPCGSCGGGVHFLYVKLTVPRHAASATALGDALGFPLRFGHAGVILTLALTLLCWPRVDTESLGGITGAFRQPMRASAVRISSHISACTGLFLFSRLCDRCVHDLASLCPAVSASVPPSYLPV